MAYFLLLLPLIFWGCAEKSTPPEHLYKIISLEEWQASQEKEQLTLSAMDHPFIHLATKEQVDKVIQKFWKGRDDIFIITIETKKLKGRLILEKNPGGNNLYYHLYDGTIPMDAVIEATKLNF